MEKITWLEKNFPQVINLSKEVAVCHGAFRKDWLLVRDIIPSVISAEAKEILTKAEALIEKHSLTTFGQVWEDMPEEQIETMGKDTKIVDYSVFPEDHEWNELFLKAVPEFQVLDDAINILFDAGELGDAVYVDPTKIIKRRGK